MWDIMRANWMHVVFYWVFFFFLFGSFHLVVTKEKCVIYDEQVTSFGLEFLIAFMNYPATQKKVSFTSYASSVFLVLTSEFHNRIIKLAQKLGQNYKKLVLPLPTGYGSLNQNIFFTFIF